MSENKTGHIYDGIEELDNAPPNWFISMFYASIAFAVAYWFYYTLGGGPTLEQEYEKARMAEAQTQYEEFVRSGGPKRASEDELKAMLASGDVRKRGQATFGLRCVSCHGDKGQGGIGPNLTDAYWLHGSKLTDIQSTISQGVLDKGMPAWGAVLSAEDVQGLVVFVRSLNGSNPPGAKAPQGELVKGM